MKNIYVGNLGFDVTEQQLQTLFATYGKVEKATVVLDAGSKQSRGFGFVEMSDSGEAETAMKALNGSGFHERNLKVSEARNKA